MKREKIPSFYIFILIFGLLILLFGIPENDSEFKVNELTTTRYDDWTGNSKGGGGNTYRRETNDWVGGVQLKTDYSITTLSALFEAESGTITTDAFWIDSCTDESVGQFTCRYKDQMTNPMILCNTKKLLNTCIVNTINNRFFKISIMDSTHGNYTDDDFIIDLSSAVNNL